MPDLGRSWWLREAMARPEFAGDPAPALRGDTTADVVILGGGYTGMWTAWFLTERAPGIDVVLLEQDICGGGPSGRNGGFCHGWWGHIGDLVGTFGDDGALSLLEAVAPYPAEIGAWCEDNDVDGWFRTGGDLAVATNPHHDGRWDSTARPNDWAWASTIGSSARRRCERGAPRPPSAAACWSPTGQPCSPRASPEACGES